MKKLFSLVLVLVFVLGFSSVALADTSIKVNGSGQVQLAPDMATLSLGVSAAAEEASDAMTQVNHNLDDIRAALAENGVDGQDIAVSSIYLYPQYDYSDFGGSEAIIGYSVSHQLDVTVRDVSLLGQLIDAVIAAGANQVNGVSFSSSQYDEAYMEAMALAVENARAKAQALAGGAGLTLGEIEQITSENVGWAAGVDTTLQAAAFSKAAGSTSVDVGSLTVSAIVTVEFEAR